MTQATLHTDRLTLVPLREEFLGYEIELDSDDEVMRYLGTGRARPRALIEQLHRNRLAIAEATPGLGFWAGFLANGSDAANGGDPTNGGTGEFVGWWILEPPEREDYGPSAGYVELGYRMLPRHWRKGFASEGARELIRHGFEELGLERIFAQTMAVNAGSRATMATVGLTYVCTVPIEDSPIPGADEGEVEYAVTRERWSAS